MKTVNSVWETLSDAVARQGAAYLTLLDPDRHDEPELRRLARTMTLGGADAILVGTSLSLSADFQRRAAAIRDEAGIPVILFPAHAGQVIPEVDAVLFLSLLSGRNPQYLVGEQVRGAPLIKAYGLEAIPVAYLLVESGRTTAVEFMSDTRPLPRDKPDIAVAHAMAAECLGMRLVYLEAGSGGAEPVPEEMIRRVAAASALPVMVGGGIVTPARAARAVEAGASFVVTGNVLEGAAAVPGARRARGADARRSASALPAIVKEFADAVHGAGAARSLAGTVREAVSTLRGARKRTAALPPPSPPRPRRGARVPAKEKSR